MKRPLEFLKKINIVWKEWDRCIWKHILFGNIGNKIKAALINNFGFDDDKGDYRIIIGIILLIDLKLKAFWDKEASVKLSKCMITKTIKNSLLKLSKIVLDSISKPLKKLKSLAISKIKIQKIYTVLYICKRILDFAIIW